MCFVCCVVLSCICILLVCVFVVSIPVWTSVEWHSAHHYPWVRSTGVVIHDTTNWESKQHQRWMVVISVGVHTVPFVVRAKIDLSPSLSLSLSLSHPFLVILYSCPSLGLDCGQCLSIGTNYQCGYCVARKQCLLRSHCTSNDFLTNTDQVTRCDRPMITSVSYAYSQDFRTYFRCIQI